MMFWQTLFAAFCTFLSVQATPTPVTISARQSITALSTSQIATFKPYTYYSGTAYCLPNTTVTWTCGLNCQANPTFQPTASGGDGEITQWWFVGYDPTLKEVIVSHQGTDTSNIIPLLEDADFFLTPLSPTLFPGVSSSILVHNGFEESHARAAPDVLAAVQKTMSAHNSTAVTMTGHSMGAALSVLDSVYLPLHLPNSTTFKTIGYGLPRVGNQAFANYLDSHIHLTHIHNMEDPVGTLPPILLGYHHGSGEIHIEDSGEWANCPGQDNPSTQCLTGDVNIFDWNTTNHKGPYDGVKITCDY